MMNAIAALLLAAGPQVDGFFAAATVEGRLEAAKEIVEADHSFEEVYAWLVAGRTYEELAGEPAEEPANEPAEGTGESRARLVGSFLRERTGAGGLRFPYQILVPEDYDPAQRYPVRLELHGGIGAPEWKELDGSWNPGWQPVSGQITVLPAGWWDAMWWEHSQVQNFEAILSEVKRTWNVDENRVVAVGNSDGCIATYFLGFRTPDRFASYVGFVGSTDRLVRQEMRPDGQMHLSNLAGQRWHLAFGERDLKTPVKYLRKYMARFEEAGALLDWYVIPKQGHTLTRTDEQLERMSEFLRDSVRDPLPDRLSWSTERVDRYTRRSWLVIDELAIDPKDKADKSNLLPRWGSTIQLRGRTVPRVPWGRVELVREGNTVTATTERVARFRLLVSPEEFDLAQPIRVVVNGTVVHEAVVEPSVETLLRWAAVDEDRSVLFASEIVIELDS